MSRARSALLGAFAFLLAGCAGGGESGDVAPKDMRVPVTVAVARRDTLVSRISLVGRIAAVNGGRAVLAAPGAATVARVLSEVGSPVRRGQVLIVLDAPELAADATAKTAEADAARKEARRQEELLREGIAARKDVEQAQSSARSSTAAASAANRVFAHAQVRAPLAGTVEELLVQPGERVDAGSELIAVVDTRTVQFEASVPAADLARLRIGQVATVSSEGSPRARLGAVRAVAPAVDSVTNAGRVLVRLANADGSLRIGAGATAVVELQSRPGVLVVPESALVPAEDGLAVLVVRADSTVEKRTVHPGVRDHGKVEIEGPVHAGESVVAVGGFGLETGMRVRVATGTHP